jgi:hypothetical protein
MGMDIDESGANQIAVCGYGSSRLIGVNLAYLDDCLPEDS